MKIKVIDACLGMSVMIDGKPADESAMKVIIVRMLDGLSEDQLAEIIKDISYHKEPSWHNMEKCDQCDDYTDIIHFSI